MVLTDTLVKNTKPTGGPTGRKRTDRQGPCLHVKQVGTYWRMNYRFMGRQRTLTLRVYPAMSLPKARQGRDKARELVADGADPSTAKLDTARARTAGALNASDLVAREWLTKTAAKRADITLQKVTAWLERDALPPIGKIPIGQHHRP